MNRMSKTIQVLTLCLIISVSINLEIYPDNPPERTDGEVDGVTPDSTTDPQSSYELMQEESSERVSQEYIEIASDSSWWYRKIENHAFGVGERLEFSVRYGKLPAGTAVMEIPEIIDFDGYDCYEIVSVAHSNNVVSVFYKVRDTVKTMVDVDGIFPRKFWKKLREGGYKTLVRSEESSCHNRQRYNPYLHFRAGRLFQHVLRSYPGSDSRAGPVYR
jgi:hypothetical protein